MKLRSVTRPVGNDGVARPFHIIVARLARWLEEPAVNDNYCPILPDQYQHVLAAAGGGFSSNIPHRRHRIGIPERRSHPNSFRTFDVTSE